MLHHTASNVVIQKVAVTYDHKGLSEEKNKLSHQSKNTNAKQIQNVTIKL